MAEVTQACKNLYKGETLSDTPLYDELEEKWNETAPDRRICDQYWRMYNVQTGAEWYEDDEGNVVFPDEPVKVAGDIEVPDLSPYITSSEFAEGGIVQGDRPNLYPVGLHYDYCPASLIPKRKKFKLFGRNQDCQGCV